MAGLPWFAVYADFPSHPKTVRLAAKLGDPNAGMHVVRLLAYATAYAPDGRIAVDMVGHAVGPPAKRGADVTAALCDAGFLSRDGDFYVIHAWSERNGAHVRKRQRDAKKPAGNGRSLQVPAREHDGIPANPSAHIESEKEREKKQKLDAAAVSPSPTRLPTREERQAARWPLATHLAAGAAERWGHAVSLPKTETDRQAVEDAARQLGDAAALQVVVDDVADAIDAGRLEETPGSLGWCVRALQRAAARPPAPPARGPRENPRPGDPDFNDQDAWWDYDAWLKRDAGPATGGAHA